MINAIQSCDSEIICQKLITRTDLLSDNLDVNMNNYSKQVGETNFLFSNNELKEESLKDGTEIKNVSTVQFYDSNSNLLNKKEKKLFADNEYNVLRFYSETPESENDKEFITVSKKRRKKRKSSSSDKVTTDSDECLVCNDNVTTSSGSSDESTKNSFHNKEDIIECLNDRFSSLNTSELNQLMQLVHEQKKGSEYFTSDEIIGKINILQEDLNNLRDVSNNKKGDKKRAWCTVNSKRDLTKRLFEENECPICYIPMTQNKITLEECGHTYHAECIRTWMKRKNTCPYCAGFSLLPEEFPPLC